MGYPLPEPYPPGQEIATVLNADNAHAGNVAGNVVKVPGGELSRIWPDGTLPGMPADPDFGIPPPAAAFTWTPPAPARNTNVTFDGWASTPGDPDYPVTAWHWMFAQTTPASGAVVTWRIPNKAGSYDAELTVTASDGQSGSLLQTLTVT